MQQNNDAFDIRRQLEGPKLLRILGAAGGLAMTGCAIFSLINFMSALSDPASLILKLYEAVFGIVIFVIELKDVQQLENMRSLFYKWLPFLTVMGGKGSFYVFAGTLGAAFWTHLILFIPAMVVVGLGVVYILIHFGKCKQMSEEYDRTVAMMQPAYQPMGGAL